MSRHRNVRNLSTDDYYDYDDDEYDDDWYDEEEDTQTAQQYSYQSRPATTFPVPATSKASGKGLGQQQSSSGSVSAEKQRLLEGMGFSSDEAIRALRETGGDAERAVELLLKGGLEGPATPGITKPPPGFATATSKPEISPAKPGISKPPPGFISGGAPTPEVSKTKAGIAKPPPGFMAPPPSSSKATGNESSPSVTFASPPSNQPAKESIFSPASTVTTTPAEATSDSDTVPTAMTPPPPKRSLPEHITKALAQQRSRLAMVVLGHVDAGKSTLMGQVLLQLGHVQKRTIAKYQKQAADVGKSSFALAWVMDEDDSERERGVTMEVGTKYITTPNHDFVLLDAPGHADFIPAMITGAAAADVGLLVIAATTGEFEAGFNISSTNSKSGGQTKEHIVLARGLGVSQLIVAVNKLDAVDWSQQRYEEIHSKLQPFLQANGFSSRRVRFVPISGLTGTNVKERPVEERLTSWYSGPTLLEAMDGFVPAQRNVDKPLRAIVTDVYQEGKGVTTKCRVVQGIVQVGDKVAILPIGDSASLTRIEHGLLADESSNRLSWAMAGDTVDLALSGLDIARIAPGCILSPTHLSLRPAIHDKIQAKILVMENLAVPIIRGAQVLWHMHSLDIPAAVSKLNCTIKRDGTQKDRPRVLTSGVSAVVEITLHEKACLETYADCRALGRFVLRRGGDTIAVGIIERILL